MQKGIKNKFFNLLTMIPHNNKQFILTVTVLNEIKMAEVRVCQIEHGLTHNIVIESNYLNAVGVRTYLPCFVFIINNVYAISYGYCYLLENPLPIIYTIHLIVSPFDNHKREFKFEMVKNFKYFIVSAA